ncbi:MAG: D-alanine--D-alanine ligase [Coriobacteriales bacterium]|jgi:D-alanine-D-alanine ligase|nr:D-alanine--D-alanine ligase [Coriobacteriales bacterium]
MTWKVAVLMGGSSFERDFSLASGKYVSRTLEREGHTVLPLDTSTSLVDVLRAEKPDVAFIALHGGHGEDGTVQSLLEYLAIPFVGSPSCVCRTTWNKSMLPHIVAAYRNRMSAVTADATGTGAADATTTGATGVNQTVAAEASPLAAPVEQTAAPAFWPRSVCLSATSFKDYGAAGALDLLSERIPSGYPLAVLPASGGSAMGINRVDDFDGLAPAILDALSFDDEVLIEEWVNGVELAVSIIGTANEAKALPPVEIHPHAGFFNTAVRLDPDLVDYYAPVRTASLSNNEAEAARIRTLIEEAALEVHRSFGCRDLSRVDLFWDGTRVKVLEINVSPGMAETSLFPMASKAAAISFGTLLNALLDTALSRQE